MSDHDSVARLLALPKFGQGVGLHRTMELLERCSIDGWMGRVDTIKITGSKGKGSVAAITERVLRALGLRVGLFTSPHLVRFPERIRVAEREIDLCELTTASDRVLEIIDGYQAAHPGDRVGAFEAFVAIAALHFAEQAVDTAVFEAGIGGRYDPTRVLPGVVVGLTSVELEHTEVLGSTRELIALDKSDLCPHGGTLVIGGIDREVERRLVRYCDLRGVELIRAADEIALTAPRYAAGEMSFEMTFRGHACGSISTRLLGEHQARNIGVASSLVWHWLRRNRPEVTLDQLGVAVGAAASAIDWPGRMQVVGTEPTIIIDVGHTPDSAHTAAVTIRQLYPEARLLLITGVSYNKDVAGVLRELVNVADEILCTRAYHKGSDPATIAAHCEAIRPGSVWRCADTIEAAVELGRERARAEGMIALIAGGLFLSIEAMEYLRGGDPRALEFF